MKKTLLISSLIAISLLSGCSTERMNFSNNQAQTTQITIDNQVVEIHLENNDIQPTNIAQAVEKVNDSVVLINAYLPQGYDFFPDQCSRVRRSGGSGAASAPCAVHGHVPPDGRESHRRGERKRRSCRLSTDAVQRRQVRRRHPHRGGRVPRGCR